MYDQIVRTRHFFCRKTFLSQEMSETLQETIRNKASALGTESAYYSTQRIYIAVSVIRDHKGSTDEDAIDIHHLQVLYRSHIAERGKLV